MFDWLTGKKAREAAKQKAEHEARVRESEEKRNQKSIELWSRVLGINTYTEASLDNFDQNSIDALYDIVSGQWFSELSRDFSDVNQMFYAYEDNEGQHYYVVFYKSRGVGRRTIDFGTSSDNLGIVRGRFELVDRILQSRVRPEAENKKDALLRILGG